MRPPRRFPPLEVRVSADSGSRLVRICGEVDLHSAPALESCLGDLVEVGGQDIVVDVADVSFIDTTGLAALVRGLQRLRARDGRVVLRSPAPAFQRTANITGVAEGLLPFSQSSPPPVSVSPQLPSAEASG